MRLVCLTSLLALLALAPAACTGAQPAEGAGLRIHVLAAADTLEPDNSGVWNMELRVVNTSGQGLYLDSLMLEVRDLDAGTVTATNLRHLGAAYASVSAGDSVQFSFAQPASCERGRLILRWHGHDGAKARRRAADSVAVGPGELERAHPSRFLAVGGRRVEIVEVAPADAARKAPGLLLVHGRDGHARGLLRAAARLAGQGYGVVCVSQPGYGGSEGPPDLVGPATIDALEAALAALRGMPGVEQNRLAAWGVSRGATAVMLLAARQPAGLRAVVGQSGLYDLSGWPENAPPAESRAVAEAGAAPDRWTVRSPLAAAARVKADVLLLHGPGDAASPLAQARAFAAALGAGGASVDTVFAAGTPQGPRPLVNRRSLDFLARLSSR